MQPSVEASQDQPASISDVRLFFAVVVPLFALFFATGDKGIPYHIDPFTNIISAATIGQTGSPVLDGYADLAEPGRYAVFGWVVNSSPGPVSQYPPGTALLAAPFYAMTSDEGVTLEVFAFNDPESDPVELVVPPLWPGAMTAALTSSLAVAFTVLATRAATGSTVWSVLAGAVLAAGTGLWLNGAYQLWQHGPASMWMGAAVWAASRSRWSSSGLFAGLGVLTRPPVAIIAAGLGVISAVKERSWIPVVRVAAGAVLGTGLLLVYNYWLFDTMTITGGYGSGFTDNLAQTDLRWYLGNLAGGFFSFDRGLFVWTPMIAIAAIGLPMVWNRSPGWATGGLLGGIALLLVQFRINRYSGGDGFFSYRYPLEAIVAATPVLTVAARHLWESTRLRLLVPTAALASIGFHLVALVTELRA